MLTVLVEGTVFKSIKRPDKKMFTTAITQRDDDLQTNTVSTQREYKTGEKLKLKCRCSAFQGRDRAFLVLIEDIPEETNEPSKVGK